MTILVDVFTPPCVAVPEVFQDELLSSPTRGDLSAREWQLLTAKRASAHRQCAACPMMVDCLYRAVVEVDVSGFVACTTEADRQMIRSQLGIEIQQSTATPYGAARVGGGPVSHEAVMSALQSFPKDTCNQLAERLSCSTSTIKRHLRRARQQKLVAVADTAPAAPGTPTVEAVLDCFDELASSKVA